MTICWYASFRSIFEKYFEPLIFAYKCSIFGSEYSVPSNTGFIVILKSPQILTVSSGFNIGTIGVVYSLWSTGNKILLLTKRSISVSTLPFNAKGIDLGL